MAKLQKWHAQEEILVELNGDQEEENNGGYHQYQEAEELQFEDEEWKLEEEFQDELQDRSGRPGLPSYAELFLFYFMIQACFCLSALATRKSLRSCNTWCKSRCEVISEDFSRCRLFILCISYKSTYYCNFAHSVHDCEVQTRGQPNHADLSGLSLFGIL